MRMKRRHRHEDAELDITSFLNLMIILVPVLLVMLVFSRITVIDIAFPDLSDISQNNEVEIEELEIAIREDSFEVNLVYATNQNAANFYKKIEQKEGDHDFALLSLTLQEVKRQLAEQGIEKTDAVILSEPNTPYQLLVSTYDTVRSYQTVQFASVVDAQLFPDISLGDASQ